MNLKNKNNQCSKAIKKFWNVTAVDDSRGEIILYGPIVGQRPIDFLSGKPVEGNFITPEGFLNDLEAIKNKAEITVRLFSYGGEVDTAAAIHDALKSLGGKKIVHVDGLAASAGVIIMCAGDEVRVHPGTRIMVHGILCELGGCYKLAELKELVSSLEDNELAIAEILRAKTGLSIGKLLEMMKKDTYMNGKEAVKLGFADTLLEGKPKVSLADKNTLMINGISHDISGKQLPAEYLRALITKNNSNNSNKGGINTMNQKRKATNNLFLKAFSRLLNQQDEILEDDDEKVENKLNEDGAGDETVTDDEIQEMVEAAVADALGIEDGETLDLEELITEEVDDATAELEKELEDLAKEVDSGGTEVQNKKNTARKLNEAIKSAAKAGAMAERKRQQQIDKIAATIGNKKLVNAAKYGKKTVSPANLALLGMMAQSVKNKTMLESLKSDTENSNVNKIKAIGNSGGAGGPNPKQEAINAAAKYKQLKNGGINHAIK